MRESPSPLACKLVILSTLQTPNASYLSSAIPLLTIMDPTSSSNSNPDVAYDFPGYLRVFKDGTVERFRGTDAVPPSIHPPNDLAVSSKDLTLLPQSNISARLFLPKHTLPNRKLPLLLYFHGGAFFVSSPFTSLYHNYLTAVVAKANVVAVSVDYRLAPEHPIPTAYEDSWAALQWVVSHRRNTGPEAWLNDHADFGRVFLAGDSAGANIVHNLAMAAGDPDMELGLDILGAALIHPYFWGSDPIGSEAVNPERKAFLDRIWPFVCAHPCQIMMTQELTRWRRERPAWHGWVVGGC